MSATELFHFAVCVFLIAPPEILIGNVTRECSPSTAMSGQLNNSESREEMSSKEHSLLYIHSSIN